MSTSFNSHDQSMNVNISNSGCTLRLLNGQNAQTVPCGAFNGGARTGYSIEQHLFSFSHQAPYNFLWSSWIIEKDAYQKQLSTIPLTFPTYSSHGADHSEVILARIEALLGENRIRLLSPTDTWLLLQCAYSHDIGMCVSENEKENTFSDIERNPYDYKSLLNNDDFKNFLLDTDSSPFYSSFHIHDRFISSIRFLEQMIDRNDQEEIRHFISQLEQDSYSQAKNIFSTVTIRYFRSRHAERTRDMLIREAQNSTLNGVLPVRLRKIVAEIDYCHGTDWQEILTRLPQRDNGLHTDHIHPQFVAALLRLGDLLDLDSNRFNPFQLELIGKLPRDSVVHKIKHMAITRFMVDFQWIDIEARYRYEEVYTLLNTHYFDDKNRVCSPIAGDRRQQTREIIKNSANALRDWIGWLHNDLKEFSHNWNAIVPSNMPGYIAALRKNDIFIGESDTPVQRDELELRYVISPRRASQIIEGSELYNESRVFIRELVQNSIDATKRQIYKSIEAQRDGLRAGESDARLRLEQDQQFMPCLQKYGVCVLIKFTRTDNDRLDALELTFRDYGIGITYEKLKQMRHIGAISKSREEQAELQSMPPWLQPTGEYGIGMQSVFTIADFFHIITYPRYEQGNMANRKRIIQLFCPELGGGIVNSEELKTDNETTRFGTDVIIRLPLVRETLLKLFGSRHPEEFDLRSDQILDSGVVVERLRHYFQETFTEDIVSLKFQYDPNENEPADKQNEPQILAEFSFPDFQNNSFRWENSYLFCKDEDPAEQRLTVYFWYNSCDGKESVLLTLRNTERSKFHLYYKGILVGNSSGQLLRIPGVDVRVNLMSGSAGELLEISRDYIKLTGYRALKNLLQNALFGFYQAVYSCLKDNDTENEMRKCALYCFFSRNPEHVMCLYHVLLALEGHVITSEFVQFFSEESVQAALEKNTDRFTSKDPFYRPREPITISTMCILYGKTYTGKITWYEALNWIQTAPIWFTDYPFEASFSSSIELSKEQNDVICALYDNLSDMYDLSYDKVRIIQDKAWKTKYIKLYTLTKMKESENYPKFEKEEYLRLCLITVNEYIDRYKSEKDDLKKQEIGNYILAFPAEESYHALAVEQFPAESPDELSARYKRFIICPCKVKKLAEYFVPLGSTQSTESSMSELAYLTQKSLKALFQDDEVLSLIKAIPLIRQTFSLGEKKEQYEQFFRDFGVFHEWQ